MFALALAITVLFLLALPVSAADDGGSIWDLLGGIGDFIYDGVKAVLDGIKNLFVPAPDYFDRAFSRIKGRFDKKFGTFLSLANYLNSSFKSLAKYRDSANLFTLKFPKNHLFGNRSVNLLSGAGGIANMVRGMLSGCVVMFTVAFAYKKVISMIKT